MCVCVCVYNAMYAQRTRGENLIKLCWGSTNNFHKFVYALPLASAIAAHLSLLPLAPSLIPYLMSAHIRCCWPESNGHAKRFLIPVLGTLKL